MEAHVEVVKETRYATHCLLQSGVEHFTTTTTGRIHGEIWLHDSALQAILLLLLMMMIANTPLIPHSLALVQRLHGLDLVGESQHAVAQVAVADMDGARDRVHGAGGVVGAGVPEAAWVRPVDYGVDVCALGRLLVGVVSGCGGLLYGEDGGLMLLMMMIWTNRFVGAKVAVVVTVCGW